MQLTMREYREEDDYWRIRTFLRQVFLANRRREYSWHVARLDYWRWHLLETCQVCDSLESAIYLWETQGGRIGAVLNAESRGEGFLQVDPNLRTAELEEEMLDVAEKHLFHRKRQLLWVLADSEDSLRQSILSRRGFSRVVRPNAVEHQHRRSLSAPIPDAAPPLGYVVRSLGDVEELPSRSWASWRAFHPDEADEAYEGWDWYHNIQRQPLYRRDLDLVAVAPSGEIASFCTIWYDDVTRSALYDPVGTMPAHQRRGLGKAVMCEGLRRLKRMGAVMALVNGYSLAANALYDSAISPECDLSEPWVKHLGT